MISLLLLDTPIVHEYYFGVSTRGWVGWIIIGLLAGWIAGQLTRGRGFGCVVDIVLGLVGAIVGGWISTKLGIPLWGGFWGSLAAATVGAVVLVAIARLFAGGQSH